MLALLFTLFTTVVGQSNLCGPGEVYDESFRQCMPCEHTYNGNCVNSCPSGTYTYANSCVDSCPNGSYYYFSECVSDCPINTYIDIDGTSCVGGCPAFTYGNECVDSCPSGTIRYSNSCVDSCPSGTKLYENMCYDSCPSGTFGYEGTCVNSCPSTHPYLYRGDCTKECWRSGMYYEAPGSTKCVYSCPKMYLWANNTCIDKCLPGQKISAYSCRDTCSESIPWVVNGTYCDVACPKLYDVPTLTCVDSCPAERTLKGVRCEKVAPTYTPYPTYTPIPTYTRQPHYTPYEQTNSTNPCNSYQYMNSKGDCVDNNYNYTNACGMYQYMNSNGTCVDYFMNPCASDEWMFNNTCVKACKRDEFMDMNGRCVNPADMCSQSMVGAVYDPLTRECRCPDGFWIHRNNSFVPPMVCSRAPINNKDRIDCKSFIPYTVYIPELNTCLCDREHPVIIPNPKDYFLPYSCAEPGTETTIKSCIPPEYFNFIEGKCFIMDVKGNYTIEYTIIPQPTIRPSFTMTAKPSESTTATRTGMPSRKPSMTSTPSPTSKPSDRPNSATSTPSASRKPKPSNLIFADVTRKPLPTIEYQPPPVNIKRSPIPSPWPKKVSVEIPPEEKPAYIDARMSLPGGNVTQLTKVEKIQELQASLACTLRMPLENIRIQNISYTDEKGVKKRMPIDPTKFMMMGDGSSECYDMKNRTSVRRQLRNLQVSKSSIEIDYTIVQPSDDILAMDVNQMKEVISTSPVLLDVATSVGSSSIESSAVEATNSNVAPAPSQTPSPVSNFIQNVSMGAGIGGTAFLVIFALIVYRVNKKHTEKVKKEKEKEVERQNRRLYVDPEKGEQVSAVNPLQQRRVDSWRAPATKSQFSAYMGESQVKFGPIKTGTSV